MNAGTVLVAGLGLLTLMASVASAQCQERWRKLRAPISNPPWPQLSARCVATFDADGPGGASGQFVIGGGQYAPIGQPAPGVASSDGIGVTALPGIRSSVQAMVMYQESLYAAGEGFLNSEGIGSALVRWTGSTWVGVGNISGQINALCVYNDELILGGNFFNVGGQSIPRLARYNGTNFLPVSAFAGTATIRLLGVHDGKLYAAGTSGSIGGVFTQGMASWDGTTWTAVPGNIAGAQQYGLASFRGKLILVGYGLALPQPSSVQQFDGTNWTPLGNMVSAPVYSIATRGDECFIGGPFGGIGSQAALYIARLPAGGATWTAMPDVTTGMPGVQTPVTGITEWNGSIVAVGNGHVSVWGICRADFNCDGVADFFDYLDFVSAFAAGETAADFNNDTVVDFFDYLDFVEIFAVGC
ncbi:MAG: hypothetical protein KGS45_11370 [Planctomycetes bacterium]|nr:hypothetical protein [Planctomycetota bacterium]